MCEKATEGDGELMNVIIACIGRRQQGVVVAVCSLVWPAKVEEGGLGRTLGRLPTRRRRTLAAAAGFPAPPSNLISRPNCQFYACGGRRPRFTFLRSCFWGVRTKLW